AQIAIANRACIQARNHDIIGVNLETARRWFTENGDIVSWHEPRAGLLAMIHVHDLENTDELSERLAESGVMLAPGSAFGLPEHLRIGIGQQPEIFAEGLERAASVIRQYRRERRLGALQPSSTLG